MLRQAKLTIIRRLHAAIWLVMAGAVVRLPFWAMSGRYDLSWGATGLVVLEGLALLANRGRCPLRTLAERYTDDRRDGFDIALPGWLARATVPVFGTLFALGEGVFLWRRFFGG